MSIDAEWAESVLHDFDQLRKVRYPVHTYLQMIDKRREEGVEETTTFPHVNDESGWEYYCFQRKSDSANLDPLKQSCRYPVPSELIQLDYVLVPFSCDLQTTLNTVLNYHYEWLLFDDSMITWVSERESTVEKICASGCIRFWPSWNFP